MCRAEAASALRRRDGRAELHAHWDRLAIEGSAQALVSPISALPARVVTAAEANVLLGVSVQLREETGSRARARRRGDLDPPMVR